MNEVLYDVSCGTGCMTINRPERSNALTPGVLREMRRVMIEAEKDPRVRVLTLTGAGDKVFCAGADLKASLKSEPGEEAFGRSDFRQMLVELMQFPKPTVALIRGHIMGGGIGIALACDIGLACEDISFSTPEIQVGMFPMMIMALLFRNIGRKKAAEMMFLGERISAAQAQEFGIINHIYPRGRFEASAEELIQKLASKSAAIMRIGKAAISTLLDERLEAEEKYLESALAEVMATEESREGLLAFIEKRPPRWH